MKVLMTADTIGGVWSYALELCGALRPHGIEVLLATLGQLPSRAQCAAVAALPHVNLRVSRYRLEWMERPWRDVEAAGEWLLDLRNDFSPDVVHLNHLSHGDLPWRVPVLTVGHSCVLSWWAAVHGTKLPARWSRYKKHVSRSLRSANAVVAPTRMMLDALVRHYGPFADARVIPNARSPWNLRPRAKEPIIFAAGRLWDEAKNIASLTRIAPALKWPVFVAGSITMPGRTAEADDAPDSSGAARMLGYLDAGELARWYGRASIYALPARYEPFGLTALEAALSGCALVLGDIESLREVWGDAATYVAPNDTEALRATLRALIDDPVRRHGLAARARRRALHFASPADQALAYSQAYRHLLEGGSPSCASYSSTTR